MCVRSPDGDVYRARDRVANEEWLAELAAAADRLDLGAEARTNAEDLFLSAATDLDDRSKRAVVAASLYAGALLAGERRSQRAVADAADVSRLTVQSRWKDLLDDAGLERPEW
jgi:transcription initiation factor TFIIIB Brf1 subunit/transcription initiation factor TFIIB